MTQYSIVYLYCALLSKGRYWSSYNKGFIFTTTQNYLKNKQRQQNYSIYTVTIIIIL